MYLFSLSAYKDKGEKKKEREGESYDIPLSSEFNCSTNQALISFQ